MAVPVTQRQRPYYGWRIAVALAVTETISWGILYYAFSVFLTPMEQDLGWTRTELTGGFSLSLLVAGVLAFPVGAWIDRHGARVLMTVGSVAASALVIAWSQVTDLTTFYLIWAGIGACSAMVLYEPAFAVIAQWFQRRRGTALAVVTIAAGFASTIFLPLSDALLRAYGWRTAVLMLGLFLGLVTIPLHALILRRHPRDLQLLPDGATRTTTAAVAPPPDVSIRTALQGRLFWLLTIGFGLTYLAGAAIRVHFIPFLISIGVESDTAAVTTGAIGAMQVLGRLGFAPLENRYSSRSIVIAMLGLQALSLALLLIGNTHIVIIGFIALFGAAQGAVTLVRPALVCDLYGTSHYGRISSVMVLFLTLANTLAPLGASILFDRYSSYQPVLWAVVAVSVAATGVFVLAKREPAAMPVLSASPSAAD